MDPKGDSERQAILRDRVTKKRNEIRKDNYISRILSVLEPEMKLCDIGCGTGHIIQDLASLQESGVYVGLDISSAMLKIASKNTATLPNILLVEGDGFNMPFSEGVFDIIITRLAEYSRKEALRILLEGGTFFEYGLGPEANKEISEFFPDRIEKENFFFPKDTRVWTEEVGEELQCAGLALTRIEDFKETDYLQDVEELMDLIEMVPLVKDFDRREDRREIEQLAQKYREREGIGITWHYYIAEARRPR
jgi:SAM-dependent methyltransferase